MRLEDEDIRAVLARAEEIQSANPQGDGMSTELEAVIHAAEQVGLARPAVERALRERFNLPIRPLSVGDLAFAKSADGKYYVAEILSASPDGFRIRFLRGSEHTVTFDELRPCSFLPGERVICPWPFWGPWTCTVISYDAAQRRIKVSDGWMETREFAIEEVWLNSPRRPNVDRRTRTRIYATLIGAGATIGAIVGSILTAVLLG
jgi:hypothetical protein